MRNGLEKLPIARKLFDSVVTVVSTAFQCFKYIYVPSLVGFLWFVFALSFDSGESRTQSNI